MSISALALYFLKLGTIGFGGPVALMGYMQRDLVDRRAVFSQDQFQHGMVMAQLAPGPTAALLCIYLGWSKGGWLGGLLSGVCFVLPSFLMMIGLGFLYQQFGMMSWVHFVLQGCTPAVLVLLWSGCFRLAKKNIRGNQILWLLAILNAMAVFFRLEHLLTMLIVSGLVYALYKKHKGRVVLSGSALMLFFFFAKVGAMVFGGGMVIVPYLQSGVVENFKWLTQQQFLDAVAFAMLTPGPIVIVATFIGFLVAGIQGAIASTLGIFTPAFLIVFLFGPLLQKWSKLGFVRDALVGIISAAVGAMFGAVAILTQSGMTNWVGAGIALGCVFLVVVVKKIPDPLLILLAGGIGLALGKSGFF